MATTTPTTTTIVRSRTGTPGNLSIATRAFLAICWRDIFVTGRQFPIFLAQILLQPIFFLFIFGRILAETGYTGPGYATLLLPGIVALTIVTTGLQSTALPLVLEFSFSKEIEDRLLAPLPVAMVGVQKIVIASVRGLIGGIVIFPLGSWIIGSSLHLSTDHVGLVALFCVLAALIGSSLGLTLGTLVDARQISIMFALVLTPLLFTGCVQYPWALLDRLKWFQIVTLVNPMTYASEGLRASLIPAIPGAPTSIPVWIDVIAGCVAIVLFSAIGVWGFIRRAVD